MASNMQHFSFFVKHNKSSSSGNNKRTQIFRRGCNYGNQSCFHSIPDCDPCWLPQTPMSSIKIKFPSHLTATHPQSLCPRPFQCATGVININFILITSSSSKHSVGFCLFLLCLLAKNCMLWDFLQAEMRKSMELN